jgi:hypothetical protein
MDSRIQYMLKNAADQGPPGARTTPNAREICHKNHTLQLGQAFMTSWGQLCQAGDTLSHPVSGEVVGTYLGLAAEKAGTSRERRFLLALGVGEGSGSTALLLFPILGVYSLQRRGDRPAFLDQSDASILDVFNALSTPKKRSTRSRTQRLAKLPPAEIPKETKKPAKSSSKLLAKPSVKSPAVKPPAKPSLVVPAKPSLVVPAKPKSKRKLQLGKVEKQKLKKSPKTKSPAPSLPPAEGGKSKSQAKKVPASKTPVTKLTAILEVDESKTELPHQLEGSASEGSLSASNKKEVQTEKTPTPPPKVVDLADSLLQLLKTYRLANPGDNATSNGYPSSNAGPGGKDARSRSPRPSTPGANRHRLSRSRSPRSSASRASSSRSGSPGANRHRLSRSSSPRSSASRASSSRPSSPGANRHRPSRSRSPRFSAWRASSSRPSSPGARHRLSRSRSPRSSASRASSSRPGSPGANRHRLSRSSSLRSSASRASSSRPGSPGANRHHSSKENHLLFTKCVDTLCAVVSTAHTNNQNTITNVGTVCAQNVEAATKPMVQALAIGHPRRSRSRSVPRQQSPSRRKQASPKPKQQSPSSSRAHRDHPRRSCSRSVPRQQSPSRRKQASPKPKQQSPSSRRARRHHPRRSCNRSVPRHQSRSSSRAHRDHPSRSRSVPRQQSRSSSRAHRDHPRRSGSRSVPRQQNLSENCSKALFPSPAQRHANQRRFGLVHISRWSQSFVSTWLHQNALGEYADKFDKLNIDGQLLMTLTVAEVDELGMQPLHKRTLLDRTREVVRYWNNR